MIKVLFLIHDLGPGGAEKVLVNLVNNMDHDKFDITVMTLFDVGENRKQLNPDIKYKYWQKHMMRGNSRIMKLLSPDKLHGMIIKEHYDVEVAYLEGPCARVISGCKDKDTKLISWIHIVQKSIERASKSFRSYGEARQCYNRFDKIIAVSESVKQDFEKLINPIADVDVIYNAIDTEGIEQLAGEPITDVSLYEDEIKLVGVGKLLKSKGFDRLINITKRLLAEGYPVHLYILGKGPEEKNLIHLAEQKDISDKVTLLGYHDNPYKYMAKCDLFVCASYAEGFSTAASEALVLGLPVCTVDVAGMKELISERQCGLISENNEEALYEGVKSMLDDSAILTQYRQEAKKRAAEFDKKHSVQEAENLITGFVK